MPKRKPSSLFQPSDSAKPPPIPKKFVVFSNRDSRSIEIAFQKLANEEDTASWTEDVTGDITDAEPRAKEADANIEPKKNTSIDDSAGQEQGGRIKVPVNEDFLFDVDIESRELAPTYWLGPIYDVRRGSWFYQEGNTLRPCDENLATQLEEGYIKAKPWRYENAPSPKSGTRSKQRPTSMKLGEDTRRLGDAFNKSSRTPSADDTLNRRNIESAGVTSAPPTQLHTHRLFGAYMNSVVTYQDATVAWLLTDDFLSRMSSSVYQRFAGGGHLGGFKVVRGFVETSRNKDTKASVDGTTDSRSSEERGRLPTDPKIQPLSQRTETAISDGTAKLEHESIEPISETRRSALERHMVSVVSSPGPEDPASQEEEVRKRDEHEIQDDYRDDDGEDQNREIEHLVLVTHGIGQRLGMKMESVNFIHDVNVLRKTLKSVYESSPDLQALNSEIDQLPKNCRIQVLPIVWRHLLDFPKQSLKKNRKEQDLSDIDALLDEEEYPSLADITVEGVPAIRNLITDLALDILLYQSGYREHIAGIVQRECNRVFKLFILRNPHFRGKVSLIGHSLGSAIMFDVLCRQKEIAKVPERHHSQRHTQRVSSGIQQDERRDLSLDFEVQDFYCIGSPIGLFQMLKGRTIAGRRSPDAISTESPLDPDFKDEQVLKSYRSSSATNPSANNSTILTIGLSSPKCGQLFNIFHPTDPIAYRVEPLISPAMSSLKPQPLPYTKRGIFGAPGQGLTGIGARVGQSVSGFWSNITTGVASSLLNRSLGLNNEGQNIPTTTRVPLSMGAGANISGGGIIPAPESLKGEKQTTHLDTATGIGSHVERPLTLIDTEIETLYSGFQKRRRSHQSDEGRDLGKSLEWQEAEDRARRLRREELKVRTLNSNGRVDYSIQE